MPDDAAPDDTAPDNPAADATTGLGVCLEPLANQYDVLLFDLDGVIYRSHEPVGHAVASLTAVIDHQPAAPQVRYVTNNASRSRTAVASQLAGFGLPATAEQVVTSAQAVAQLIAADYPPRTPVLVIGSAALRDEIAAVGLTPVEDLADRPEVVVQGFDPDLGWTDLARASRAIGDGARWYASNTDLTLPVDWGVAPGNGSLVQAVANATGVRPTVAGKPEAAIMAVALGQQAPERALAIGDRLDTDIEAARRHGLASLWVATGIDDLAAVAHADPQRRPDFVAPDLRALSLPQPPVRLQARGLACCGPWRADAHRGVLAHRDSHDGDSHHGDFEGDESRRSEPVQDAIAAMRAVVAAAWSAGPAAVHISELVQQCDHAISQAIS